MASLAAHLANHDTFARLAVNDLNRGILWRLDGVDYLQSKVGLTCFLQLSPMLTLYRPYCDFGEAQQ